MAAIGRSSILAVILAALSTFLFQNKHFDSKLEGVPSGKTRVLDLSYAISDKLVPWPGDGNFFEAKVNATIEKNGFILRGASGCWSITARIWMRQLIFRRGGRQLTKFP